MLIVVHHRNLHRFLQRLFNIKTFRSFDILEINASKSGLKRFYNLHKLFGIFFIDLYIEYINICKHFKQYALSLHHRLAGFGTNIAQTQNCCSVADYRYQVSFSSVFIYLFYIFIDLFAGFCNTGRISQRKVSLRFSIFTGNNFYFSRPSLSMVFKCLLFSQFVRHNNTIATQDK